MLAGLREGGGGGPDELFRERDGEVERELWVEETGDGEPERDGFKTSWGLIDLGASFLADLLSGSLQRSITDHILRVHPLANRSGNVVVVWLVGLVLGEERW
jgi:hypothetical protein